MFRRKDETTADFSAETTTTAATASATPAGANGVSHTPSVAAAPVAAAPAAAPSSPYAPAARPTAAAEPARTSAPSTNYRPQALADLGRPAARTSEPARIAPVTAAPAMSFSGEKPHGVTKSNRRILTVGNDILLKGEIATCDRLVIEGRVEAKLSDVHTVEIAECGSFKGTAEVEEAEISGIFEGDLIVRGRIVIYATGEVRGNISYGEIEIERGGRLTGQIKTVTAAATTAAKSKAMDVFQDAAKGRTTKEASVVAA
jgi:cytoskeletal protein CcmA (bactofilin family)